MQTLLSIITRVLSSCDLSPKPVNLDILEILVSGISRLQHFCDAYSQALASNLTFETYTQVSVSVVTGSRPHKVEAFTHDKHTQVFPLYMVACSSRQPKPPKGRQLAFHRSPPVRGQKASLLTCPGTDPAKGYDQLGN